MSSDWDWVSPSEMVRIRGNEVMISAQTKAECQICAKELRLVRQQLVLDRRVIEAGIRELRAHWRQFGRVSDYPSTGRQIGEEIFRAFLGDSKSHEHQIFEARLGALQERRETVIARIADADQIILAIQQHLLDLETSAAHPTETTSIICRVCGFQEFAGARFCGNCGTALPAN